MLTVYENGASISYYMYIMQTAHIVTLYNCSGNFSWSFWSKTSKPALSKSIRRDSMQRVTEESTSSNSSNSDAMFSFTKIIPPLGLSPFTQRCMKDTRSSRRGQKVKEKSQ